MKVYTILLTALAALLSGCQNIPAGTPVLMQKNNERLENQATVTQKVFQQSVDEIGFLKDDIKEIRIAIEQVVISSLSNDDQAKVKNAIAGLKKAERALTLDPKIIAHPDKFKAAVTEIIGNYKLVATILSSRVDQQKLISELIASIARKDEAK